MDNHESLRLNGYIFEWPIRALTRKDLLGCRGVEFVDNIGDSLWERFQFTSDEPLHNESLKGVRGPYVYVVVCRRSGPRIALLSVARDIVDAFVYRLTREVLGLRLRRVSIAVDALVKLIVARPTTYCLSYTYARVPAFGAALRNASFFGDDLGEASLFRESVNLMTFHQCGIRAAVGGPEIVRLGSDGRIAFNLSASSKVVEVEEVLRFLRRESYLHSELLADHE